MVRALDAGAEKRDERELLEVPVSNIYLLAGD